MVGTEIGSMDGVGSDPIHADHRLCIQISSHPGSSLGRSWPAYLLVHSTTPTEPLGEVKVLAKMEPVGVKAVALLVGTVADNVRVEGVVGLASQPTVSAMFVQVCEDVEQGGIPLNGGVSASSGAKVRRAATWFISAVMDP